MRSNLGVLSIIHSFVSHHSIILSIGHLPFLGSGGFAQRGLAASGSLISKPGSVMSKRIHFISKISALDSSVVCLCCTAPILARSLGFFHHGFNNPPLKLCLFPRFIFLIVLPAVLVWLQFVLSSYV
jgi:hypothetical protein